MKILKEAEIEKIQKELQENFDQIYDEYRKINVRLEFPLGEIMNPKIAGFVWVWNLMNKIKIETISKKDRFNAQGLEGKATVETDLVGAVLAYWELPRYRRAIVKL